MSKFAYLCSVDVVGFSRAQAVGAGLTGQDEVPGFAKPTIDMEMFHVKRCRCLIGVVLLATFLAMGHLRA